MKRILLTAVILLSIGIMAYAQSPSSRQVRQEAQQYLSQAQDNAAAYEATLEDLKGRNNGNGDANTFARLKAEIDRIEAHINQEEQAISSRLDTGTRVSSQMISRIENFINQHQDKVNELEAFVSQY